MPSRFAIPTVLTFGGLGIALLGLSACATLGDPVQTVDLRVEAHSPPGFVLGRPVVTLEGANLRLRGRVCRKPLSIRPQPRTLRVELFDAQARLLHRRDVALNALPPRSGPRCVYYAALGPAELTMDRAVITPIN